MYLSSPQNKGIIERLDRLCGSSITDYPIIDKLSDINDALDWYFSLAFKADRNWNFDDINESSPPIDTQNIVSGTNRYKFGSFTEKIHHLIKLEVLDENGLGVELIPETMDSLDGTFQELYLNSTNNSGTPTHYIKYGDFVYLRPFPNYAETDGLKVYFNRPATKFEVVACQAEADDNLITAVGHGLAVNDTVIFETTGTIMTGITAGTTYYVIATGLTDDVFSVSTTLGGSAVDITGDGTNCYFLKTNVSPGIPEVHHPMIVRKASLSFLSEVNSNKLGWIPNQVLKDEIDIKDYFGQRDEDKNKIMIPHIQDNR